MSAGRIAVKVHSASGFRASPSASEPGLGEREVYCVCEVPGFGRLATEPRSATGAAPDEPTLWEQELTFEVGPTQEPKQLRAALYAVSPGEAPGTDEFIGSGSLNLAHLEEVQAQHALRIPLVSGAGAHLADLSLSLRFFHSRSPGRQRDAEGREYLDEALFDAGPMQAARLLNERHPRSLTASPRPGSPRIKPPLKDPLVPELQASVRTPLADEKK